MQDLTSNNVGTLISITIKELNFYARLKTRGLYFKEGHFINRVGGFILFIILKDNKKMYP